MDVLYRRESLISGRFFIPLCLLAYVVLCAALMVSISSSPPLADAKNYMDAALGFRSGGFLNEFGSVRTYGYPSLLAIESFLSGYSLTNLRLVSGIIQCTAYFGATAWLSVELHRKNVILSGVALLGLSTNVFNIVLLADTMTEAPSLIIALALAAISLRAARTRSMGSLLIWFAAGSSLAFFDLMIRPANLVVVAAWGVAAAALWWNSSKRRIVGGAFVILATVLAIFIFAPQVYYNFNNFHRFSLLPTADLGNIQARFGIEMMKYATSLSEDGAGPIIYRNPLYDGTSLSGGALHWYLTHPILGIGTTILHVYNSFNFDYLFVYVEDLNPPFGYVMTIVSWFMISIGSYYLLAKCKDIINLCVTQPEYISFVLFLTSLGACTIALNSTIAVENRFNLIPISILNVSALVFIVSRTGRRLSHDLVVSGFAIVAALAAFAGSEWAKGYSAPIMQARKAPKTKFSDWLTCGEIWDAAQRRPGRGFSVPEKDTLGPFRWTVAQTASIAITPCSGPAEVEILIAFALTQDNLSKLKVTVADQGVSMKACSDPLGTLLRGHIDASSLRSERNVELKLAVPKLDVIAGTPREFGVAIRSIAMHPELAAPEPFNARLKCK